MHYFQPVKLQNTNAFVCCKLNSNENNEKFKLKVKTHFVVRNIHCLQRKLTVTTIPHCDHNNILTKQLYNYAVNFLFAKMQNASNKVN